MKQELRVGLIGANGRMGKAIAALESPSFRIAAAFSRDNPLDPGAEVDLFLDVSDAAALSNNLRIALLSKKPIVVGTTGAIDFKCLETASRSIPVFYSANFSFGMALMRRAAEDLARRFPRIASIKIIEEHHAHKKDAPSGTALALRESVLKSCGTEVEITSIRSGQIIGKHALHFQVLEETLSLIHEVQSRDAFARGAIEAARFLALQSPGLYTMDDLLK